MGKRKPKRNKNKKEDFGTCEFHCKHCSHTFEIEWETIWDIQEVTHGYVGFHTTDTFISCPKCDKMIDDNGDDLSYDDLFIKGTFLEKEK